MNKSIQKPLTHFLASALLCSTTHYFHFARMILGKLPKKKKKSFMYSEDENDGVVWGASKWFSAEWTDIVPAAAAAIFCSRQNKEKITNLKAPVVLMPPLQNHNQNRPLVKQD